MFFYSQQFVSLLNLKKGQTVLDVGCGIGGSAFYMARDFGVKVLGIDLSSNMINLALQRRDEVGISVEVGFYVFFGIICIIKKYSFPLRLCKMFDDT